MGPKPGTVSLWLRRETDWGQRDGWSEKMRYSSPRHGPGRGDCTIESGRLVESSLGETGVSRRLVLPSLRDWCYLLWETGATFPGRLVLPSLGDWCYLPWETGATFPGSLVAPSPRTGDPCLSSLLGLEIPVTPVS